MIKVMNSIEHPSQTDGTSPTMTNGQRMPEDVWQAILRLEAKRVRQADLIDDDDDDDDEPSDDDMMSAFGTKWHDGL